MRVKICGMMRPRDVTAALDSGADAVGFVVASPSSPRNLSLSKAQKLMASIPVFTTKAAVTTAHEPKTLLRICRKLKPDALQLHHHTPRLVRLLRRRQPEIKLILATAIRDGLSVKIAKRTSAYSDAILADTPNITGLGGTGRTHDWRLTAILRNRIHPHPLILAGGLTPDNVRAAIGKVRPFAVDVSTGVERAIGVKDHDKIRRFIMNAKGSLA